MREYWSEVETLSREDLEALQLERLKQVVSGSMRGFPFTERDSTRWA